MAEPIPDKGRVLTAISAFWFDAAADIAPNHMVATDPSKFPALDVDDLAGRSMLVRRAEMLPIECIVRGYVSGSAWKEYRSSGTMHGVPLPKGLQESEQLPEPVFTPSTKADTGHDENISVDQAADLVGPDVGNRAALRGVAGGAGLKRPALPVLVEVTLRAGVADPQGATIERALPALGFDGVEGVRVGKAIRFTVEASDREAARAAVDDLCRRFLANPVIEDTNVTIGNGDAP